MIDCPNGDVRDVLPDYVNDRLGAHQRAEVERHLETCAACRGEVDLLRDLGVTMRHAPSIDVDAIAAAIPPYRAPVRHGWTSGWRTAAAIAAVAIGGASIALLRDRAPADREVRPPQVVQVPAPSVEPNPSSIVTTPPRTPTPDRAPEPQPAPARELALAGSAIGELSDVELSALVEGIESLDALPSTEVEGTQPLSLSAQEDS